MMIVSLCSGAVKGTQLLYRNGIILQEARRGHCPSVIKVCGLGRETTKSTRRVTTRSRFLAWTSATDEAAFHLRVSSAEQFDICCGKLRENNEQNVGPVVFPRALFCLFENKYTYKIFCVFFFLFQAKCFDTFLKTEKKNPKRVCCTSYTSPLNHNITQRHTRTLLYLMVEWAVG